MSQSSRSSTPQAGRVRRATRTDAAVIAQYIQDLSAGVSRPAPDPA